MNRHFIGLMAGLSTSLHWSTNPYSQWAIGLEKRLSDYFAGRDDVVILSFSSDWNFDRAFFDMVRSAIDAGEIGVLTGAGHSKGSAEWLLYAKEYYGRIEIPYLGLMDMTWGDVSLFGAKAGGNIRFLEEFHGDHSKVDFDPSFEKDGCRHLYHETELDHLRVTRSTKVMQSIFAGIVATIPDRPADVAARKRIGAAV